MFSCTAYYVHFKIKKNNSVIFFSTQHTCCFPLVKYGYNIQGDQNRLSSQNTNPENLMHDKMLSGSLCQDF